MYLSAGASARLTCAPGIRERCRDSAIAGMRGVECTGKARCDGVMWGRRVAVTVLVMLLSAAAAAGALAVPSITDVRIGQQQDLTRLVIDLTDVADFEIFTLREPPRVVIDLPAVRWTLAERTLTIGRAGVTQLRFGHFKLETSRIVFDLVQPFAVRQAQLLELETAAYRLVVDLEPEPEPSARAEDRPQEPAAQARRDPPAAPLPQAQPKPTTTLSPTRLVIAIDPGHGGRDPGAISESGIQERTVVLTFARELSAILESSGRYRAVMTRDRDRKVGLHERVEIARDAGADAFLSIHADKVAEDWVRGAAVYTLSDEASDEETAALAARENKVDIVSDVDLSEGYDEEVAKVLISLVQQNTMNCSAALAAHLLPELGSVAPLLKRAHRFGNFRVLKAPDIPSVLIELGFLSNDQDTERLRRKSHRAALARAIMRALDDFFGAPC